MAQTYESMRCAYNDRMKLLLMNPKCGYKLRQASYGFAESNYADKKHELKILIGKFKEWLREIKNEERKLNRLKSDAEILDCKLSTIDDSTLPVSKKGTRSCICKHATDFVTIEKNLKVWRKYVEGKITSIKASL